MVVFAIIRNTTTAGAISVSKRCHFQRYEPVPFDSSVKAVMKKLSLFLLAATVLSGCGTVGTVPPLPAGQQPWKLHDINQPYQVGPDVAEAKKLVGPRPTDPRGIVMSYVKNKLGITDAKYRWSGVVLPAYLQVIGAPEVLYGWSVCVPIRMNGSIAWTRYFLIKDDRVIKYESLDSFNGSAPAVAMNPMLAAWEYCYASVAYPLDSQ